MGWFSKLKKNIFSTQKQTKKHFGKWEQKKLMDLKNVWKKLQNKQHVK